MGLGFFQQQLIYNIYIYIYYGLLYDNGFGLFSTSANINIYIMGYYMIMGLDFFQHQLILIYILWVII
jgi:hypothetical protein